MAKARRRQGEGKAKGSDRPPTRHRQQVLQVNPQINLQ
jgi:hypothetical protein